MSSQEEKVYHAFYQNAAMGVDAVTAILPKAAHTALRQELCKQLEFYQSRKDELLCQMREKHIAPKSESEIAKLWTNVSVQWHTLGGTSASEIAKLMCKGTNTGVIQLTQVLHESPEISEDLKRHGKAFLRHEEAYMERLKAYL